MGGHPNSEQRLKQGKEALEQMGKWAEKSMAIFGNKWHLMQAEYSASIGEHEKAQLEYTSSIKAAKDHGLIHELALALELFGNIID